MHEKNGWETGTGEEFAEILARAVLGEKLDSKGDRVFIALPSNDIQEHREEQ